MKNLAILVLFIILIIIVNTRVSSYDEINRLKYCSEKYKNNIDKLSYYSEYNCNIDPYCKSVTVGDFKACVSI